MAVSFFVNGHTPAEFFFEFDPTSTGNNSPLKSATPGQGLPVYVSNTHRLMETHQVHLPEQKESLAVSNPAPGKSGGASKSWVTFSLVGRVKEKKRAREKGISFLQLGRLASLTPSLQTGFTLQ